MNVNDGTVTSTVPCEDYTTLIRPYAEPMFDRMTTEVVTCYDNCDGATATCEILRGGITYTVGSVPYPASSTLCTPPTVGTDISRPPVLADPGFFSSFTLSDIATTYIGFKTNMVAIEFDDTQSPPAITIWDVERDGDASGIFV